MRLCLSDDAIRDWTSWVRNEDLGTVGPSASRTKRDGREENYTVERKGRGQMMEDRG